MQILLLQKTQALLLYRVLLALLERNVVLDNVARQMVELVSHLLYLTLQVVKNVLL